MEEMSPQQKKKSLHVSPGSLWTAQEENENINVPKFKFGSSLGRCLKLQCLILSNNKTPCRFYKKIIMNLHEHLESLQLLYPYKNIHGCSKRSQIQKAVLNRKEFGLDKYLKLNMVIHQETQQLLLTASHWFVDSSMFKPSCQSSFTDALKLDCWDDALLSEMTAKGKSNTELSHRRFCSCF